MDKSYLFQSRDLPPAWDLADRIAGSIGTKSVAIHDGTHQRLDGYQRIDAAMRLIAETKGPLYRVVKGRVVAHSLVAKLASAYRLTGNDLYWRHEAVEVAPTIRLLCDWAFKSQLFLLPQLELSEVAGANLWFDTLREEMRSPKFKERQRRRRNDVRDRLDSIYVYLNSLFERYSKILIVRIDTGYALNRRRDVSVSQAKSDRAKFIAAARTLYPRVGYCVRTELGPHKGLHNHFYFFFNGHEHREDISLANVLGELWEQIALQGKFWNCNLQKDSYEKSGCLGIGMVHYADLKKRSNLYRAIGYLAKLDNLVRMLPDKIGKSFVRGQLPNSDGASVGRPREAASEWSWSRQDVAAVLRSLDQDGSKLRATL